MKPLILLILAGFFCQSGFTQKKSIKTAAVSEKIQPAISTVTTKVTTELIRDTIPKKMYKLYSVDKARFLHYQFTVLNDSVKLLKAGAGDWNDYSIARNTLIQTLKNNPFNNSTDYISSGKDFESLGLIDKNLQPNTARVCLRQLTYNINVANMLLNKKLADPTDLKLLSMTIRNIDTLCLSYIVPYVYHIEALMIYPKVAFKVFDKNGIELKQAACYLVTPKICRDIACKSCSDITVSCNIEAYNNIITQHDYVFDCGNTPFLPIAPGLYHIFIVNKGKVLSYRFWDTDALTALQPGQVQTINLHIE